VADDFDSGTSPPSSSTSARRVRYGRQDYFLFVRTSSSNATLRRCAELFDIAPSRLKLVAGGRVLATEVEVEVAAACGSPIMCLGTRRAAVVRTESAPHRAVLRARGAAAAAWRIALRPACRAVLRQVPVEAAARAVSPWIVHAWWGPAPPRPEWHVSATHSSLLTVPVYCPTSLATPERAPEPYALNPKASIPEASALVQPGYLTVPRPESNPDVNSPHMASMGWKQRSN